ncbi:MAG: hypothetical protein WCD21_22325 [Streptomyces sp.]
MSQGKGGKPDPRGDAEPSKLLIPDQLITAHTSKQLHPKAVRAAQAMLAFIAMELLDEAAKGSQEADATHANEAGGKEIQPRHVDAAIRADAELRRPLAFCLIESAPAPRAGAPSVQRAAVNTPDGAFDDSIDRLMKNISPEGNVTVGTSAKGMVSGLLTFLVEQLMYNAAVISTRVNSDVVHAEDVRAAAQVMLTGELCQLVDREMREAVIKA